MVNVIATLTVLGLLGALVLNPKGGTAVIDWVVGVVRGVVDLGKGA